jgi:hypothetical protein
MSHSGDTIQLVTFHVPGSSAVPMEVKVPHSGLRMTLVSRESLGRPAAVAAHDSCRRGGQTAAWHWLGRSWRSRRGLYEKVRRLQDIFIQRGRSGGWGGHRMEYPDRDDARRTPNGRTAEPAQLGVRSRMV